MSASVSHRLEYHAMRAAIGALKALGWNGGVRTGELLGRAAYSVVPIRRKVAEKQIAFAFPGMAPRDVRRVASAAYSNLGRTVAETALLPHRDGSFVLQLMSGVSGWDAVESALARGNGLLLVTGHIGNWELAGSWLAARGLDFAAVARRMSNQLFADYLGATRADLGMKIFYEADAVKQMPRHLRGGGVVALLADQGVRGLASTYVPFFGRLARTPRGPAVLAIRLQTPLVYGCCVRRPDGRFHIAFESIDMQSSGDREVDVDRMVADYTAALERSVRQYPEQYFWMHRRWRRQPPGQPLLDEEDL